MGELEKLEWEWPWSCYPVCCVPICTIRFWCFDVCFPCSSFLLTVSVRPMLSFSRRMVHVTCDWCHLHYNFSFIWEKTYNLSGNCFIPGCSGKEKETLSRNCRPAADEHWNIKKKKDWNERHEQTKGVHARYSRAGQETNPRPCLQWHGWVWFSLQLHGCSSGIQERRQSQQVW